MKDQFSPGDFSEKWPEEVKQAFQNLKLPSFYDSLLVNEKLTVEVHKQGLEIKQVSENLTTVMLALNQITEMMAASLDDDFDLDDYDDDVFEDEDFDDEDESDDGTESETDSGSGESDKLKLIDLPEKSWRFKGDESTLSDEDEDEGVEFLKENLDSLLFGINTVLINVMDILVDLSNTSHNMVKQLENISSKKSDLSDKTSLQDHLMQEFTGSITEKIDEARYKVLSQARFWDFEVIKPLPGDRFDSNLHDALEVIEGGGPGTIARVVRQGYRHQHQVLRPAEVILYR